MLSDSIDGIYFIFSALGIWVLYRAIRAGEFESMYGEKLSIRRAENPILFWGQAIVIFAIVGLLIWAGVT